MCLSPTSQHVISGQMSLICVRPLPKFATLQPFSDATKPNCLNQTHYGKVTRNKYLFETVLLSNSNAL